MPTLDNRFLDVMKSGELNPTRISGISAGNNHCYRNSVLTALLSSGVVSRYLMLWHCTVTYGEFQGGKSSMMTGAAQLAAQLFFSKNFSQASLDNFVAGFWRKFCYEKDKKGKKLRKPSFWSWREYHGDKFGIEETDPQDAHEFLSWLLIAMPRQFTIVTPDLQPNAPLERFEWVFKSQFACRTMCGKCQYPVRRRIQAEPESCLVLHIPRAEDTHPGLTVPQPLLSDLVDNSFSTQISTKCCRCERVSECIQQRKLRHAPALLALTISRGRYDRETLSMVKDCTAVVIPEHLDLSAHLNIHEFGEGSKVTYSLCSIVSHKGNQLDSGHYVSYVRGAADRSQWFEVNDQTVTQVTQAYFDDSAVSGFDKETYVNRFTPYIIFYERDFKSEILTPGREAVNVGEGENVDEQPSHWTGREREVISPIEGSESDSESNASSQEEDENLLWTIGSKKDEQSLPAVLLVKIIIGEVEVELPRHVISHLNWKPKKDIKIDVKLRAPKGAGIVSGGNDFVEASLSDIQDEAYYNQRRQKEKSDSTPLPTSAWNKYWHPVKRSADDLTERQVEEIKRVCREFVGDASH